MCISRFFVYALNVCKFSIWVARNDFRFRDVRPGAIPVLERVKSRLRFHLPLFFRRTVAVILPGSGVLTVWLVQSEMAVCFYRSSF